MKMVLWLVVYFVRISRNFIDCTSSDFLLYADYMQVEGWKKLLMEMENCFFSPKNSTREENSKNMRISSVGDEKLPPKKKSKIKFPNLN